ncbi:MAG TPA: histidine kinase N-terminal 7TM domain-containing protein [Isosphaeraceae bacterium]|nr:histidine kinase N-terminal 7TM domain-containing protein [Isosphaeraceae bacterium]
MDRIISQSRLPMQLNPASLVFFLAAALSAWLVVLAWGRRNEPSGPPLISLLVFEALWALCEAIEAVLLDPSAQAVMYRLKLSSVALVPPSLLFFVLEYTSRTGAAPPRFKVLILAVPAISISLIATSGEHRLFLTGMEKVEIQGYRLLSPRYGPAFWIHTSYCYALLCLSAWLLARSALALGGVLRKQMLFLSACLLIPLAINVADLLRVIPLPYREYDLTAATFVVTGVLGLVLLRRFHLINVAPVSYSLVVQEMLDAIIVLDAWGRIAGLNRAALRLVGRLDKDIVGLPGDVIPSWLRIPEHLSRLEGAAELSYRLGADSRDPGFTYDVRVSRFPHGRVPGWLVIIRDISAQSRAEAERTARIAAEQANWAKDAFLAKLSHELRTPLTPVLAITSAALDQPSIPPGLRSSLEIVQRNVLLEARLIDDLLDQSLITLGKLRLRTELVDAHGLLHQSLENCAEFIRDADLIARLDLSATNSRISADPGRLQQVFWNLIINAARYSPARSHLTIRTRNIAADALEIEFQDEGRGLESSQLEEIFKPFIQARAGGAERGPGLGLGLSIGRSIVEAHGGSLVAESPGPGRGATFRVVLRTADPTEVATIDRQRARGATVKEAAVEEPEEARKSRRPTTILLVDDNKDSLSALTMSLSLLGYEVRPANSLRTALAAAEHEGYDLIVSDLELGDGTGLDLLSSLGPGRSVPAIALTGYGSEEDRKMCLEAGFEMHIVKPVQTRQLSEAIRSIIQKQSINS